MYFQVVELRGQILEKPSDEAHATEMLQMLSGHTHAVHTGVSLLVCEDCLASRSDQWIFFQN